MRINKRELQAHEQAMDIVYSDRQLRNSDIEFVFQNFDPRAIGVVSKNQAYFTPPVLSRMIAETVGGLSAGTVVVDLCAGIGRLSHTLQHFNRPDELEIHAIEFNQEYVEIGKRVLPNVHWHYGDFRNKNLWANIPEPKWVISNPPFANLGFFEPNQAWLKFKGCGALQSVEAGLRTATCGIVAIIPQSYSTVHYSGRPYAEHIRPSRGDLKKYLDIYPDTEFYAMGHDTSPHLKEWKGASPKVEVLKISWDGDFAQLGRFYDREQRLVPQFLSLKI